MALRWSATGLTGTADSRSQRAAAFADSVLRGIGQVMLQDSAVAGAFFLAGIFWNSALFGWATLAGAVASTATASVLGVESGRVRAGLFGFNGALTGIALLYFLAPSALAWGYVVVAAAASTVVMAALVHLCGRLRIPALTAPFVLTTLCFVLACARFGRLQTTSLLPTAGLPSAATVEGVVTSATVLHGLFMGVAQVFFQGSAVTGALFVVGLLVSSRKACAAALGGSLVGLIVAWLLGAGEPAIRAGAFGFNSVLTGILLWAGPFKVERASLGFGLLGVTATAVVFGALSAALQPIGMPALTAPFVLVGWSFLLAAPVLGGLHPAEAAA